MRTGVGLINEERQRQISELGWTAAHDAMYEDQELARAASAYARVPPERHLPADRDYRKHFWPWPKYPFKPSSDRIDELVKAGALIAAEIDRIIAQREKRREV